MHNAWLTVRRPGTPINTATGYRKKETSPREVVSRIPVCFGNDTGSRRIGAGRGADHVKDISKPAQVIMFEDWNYDDINIGDVAFLQLWAEKASEVEMVVTTAERSVGIHGSIWQLAVEAAKFSTPS